MKQKQSLINFLLVLSGTAMTWSITRNETGTALFSILGIAGSFAILCLLAFKYQFPEETFDHIHGSLVVLAMLFASVACYYQVYKPFPASLIPAIPYSIQALGASAAVFPAFFVLFAWFFKNFSPIALKFITGLDKQEKYQLALGIAVFTVAIFLSYSRTTVFYDAPYDDLVYNADSHSIISSNAFLYINSPKNNIKQPLFGLFSMPFAIFAKVLSKILFFLPNSYPVILLVIQLLAMQIMVILISRMMNLPPLDKGLFFLMFQFTYPFLLFALLAEQYVFSLFWIILLVYSFLTDSSQKVFYFTGAAGSMLTSIILFPLVTRAEKLETRLKQVFSSSVKFLAVLIVFGQLPLVLDSWTAISGQLSNWTGAKLTFQEKFFQYSHFIASCLFKPNTTVDVTYHLAPANTLNIWGILLLALAVAGFWFNREKLFPRISLAWLFYSFILLCLLGWGTRENGLILYSLYFSWSLTALVYLAVIALLQKWPVASSTAVSTAIITLAPLNLPAIYEIIQWGLKYFPY